MSEQLYRVVFNGAYTGEYDEAEARARFQKLFRLDDRRLKTLFSGKEYVIKNNVTEAVAMDFMIKVSETGCECFVEEIVEEEEGVDYDEKRRGIERRLRYRRGPRPGAIVPDRRLRIRRKKDRRHFL
ncbi:MAG: hypothetical protein KDI19_16205, partial [Pseudomonadales bacterium]|nr:hypothetical protein [Pseudomonadales bacterium]